MTTTRLTHATGSTYTPPASGYPRVDLGHAIRRDLGKPAALDVTIAPVARPAATAPIRFVSQNVKALPLMPQPHVTDDVDLTGRQGDVIGWQEIGPDRYDQAVKALGADDPGTWRHVFAGLAGIGGYESPISFRRDLFRFIDADALKLVPARAKVSRARFLTWLELEDRATGIEFTVTNLHMIAGAWNDKPKPHKAERPAWWNGDRDRFVGWLEDYIAAHPERPIVNLGDYNSQLRRTPPLGKTVAGRRVRYLVGKRSIDYVAVIPGDGVDVLVEDRDGDYLTGRHSDHQGRRGVVRFRRTA